MKTQPQEQYRSADEKNNYEVSDVLSTSLPAGRIDPIAYPRCNNNMEYQPTMMGTETDTAGNQAVNVPNEQKVGDHHEYA